MARERIIKYPPKRGRLKRSEVKRVVERVVHGKRDGGEAEQPWPTEKRINHGRLYTQFRKRF